MPLVWIQAYIQGDKMVLFDLQGNDNTVTDTKKPSSSSSMDSGKEKGIFTLKDKQEMTPQERSLYNET